MVSICGVSMETHKHSLDISRLKKEIPRIILSNSNNLSFKLKRVRVFLKDSEQLEKKPNYNNRI